MNSACRVGLMPAVLPSSALWFRAPSSLCKLEGEVPRCDASSLRYHHFSGSSSVAARICWRIAGKSASRTRDLRITRKYLRGSRKTSIFSEASFRIRHRTGALFHVDLGRERLAHMEGVFPGDAGDEVTGAGLEVNCVAFLIGRFLERDHRNTYRVDTAALPVGWGT